MLDAASTTSTTITNNAKALDALLLNAIGFPRSGIDLLGPNKDNLVHGINLLEPTTSLLMKYNPEYTCLLVGAQDRPRQRRLTRCGGGNGYSVVLDAALLLGDDPYQYPDNLPIVGAKGGPGGKPGCGSLPDAAKNFPVRHLVTNTGWGTGLDCAAQPRHRAPWLRRLLPGHPGGTAAAEPPAIPGARRPGRFRTPGAPPYGAPLYAPDGTPLYPGVPPAPPQGAA